MSKRKTIEEDQAPAKARLGNFYFKIIWGGKLKLIRGWK